MTESGSRSLRVRVRSARATVLVLSLVALEGNAWAQCTDADGDGLFREDQCGTALDCNDADPLTHPFATELCDGYDRDCDGQIDNDPACVKTCADARKIYDVDLSKDVAGGGWHSGVDAAWTGSGYAAAWRQSALSEDVIRFQTLDVAGRPLGDPGRIRPVAIVYAPRVVWTGSEYGLAWWSHQNVSTYHQLRFTRLDAAGAPIGSDLLVVGGIPISIGSALVWTGSEYGLAWSDERTGLREIYFARIGVDGQKIGDDVQITTNSDSFGPELLWTGSEYGLAWIRDPDGANSSLRFTRLNAEGMTIGEEVEVSTDGGYSVLWDGLAWTGSEYAIAFTSDRGGNREVYLARLDASGVEIGEEQQLTFDSEMAMHASLVWNGEEFGLVWADESILDPADIYFSRVDAFGNVQSSEVVRMTDTPEDSIYPRIVWTGREYGVFWEQDYGWEDVYFTRVGCNCPGDDDGDGLSPACGDCDDEDPETYALAPQICFDGLNNDCLHPNWPSLVGTNELDDDGDTLSECAGDCDDTNENTYPEAAEANDGQDNQCAGEEGYGVIDEISGDSGFYSADDKTEYSWTAQAGATGYEVARSSRPDFSVDCFTVTRTESFWTDAETPPGSGIYYYLVRALTPNAGSWGRDSAGVERVSGCL
jgi:hypothetical protein